MNLLCIPASLIPVEQVFTIAGFTCIGYHYKLMIMCKSLEQKLMLLALILAPNFIHHNMYIVIINVHIV